MKLRLQHIKVGLTMDLETGATRIGARKLFSGVEFYGRGRTMDDVKRKTESVLLNVKTTRLERNRAAKARKRRNHRKYFAVNARL